MSSVAEEALRERRQQLPVPSVMDRLRRETTAEHTLLERETRMMSPDLSLGDYGRYLTEMWAVHAVVEPKLAQVSGLADVLPDLQDRRKLPLLERDLDRLAVPHGARASLSPDRRSPLPCASLAEILGVLYVLEGSTLGGRLIRRHLAGVLGPRVDGATSYLDAYSDVGAMWRRFGSSANAYGAAHGEAQDAMVAAAVATFRFLLAGWNAR